MGKRALVRDLTLSDFPFLASLATSERPVDRTIWMRVAADHFAAVRPSDPHGLAAFADAMIAALAAADPATRMEIARKLAPSAETPPLLRDWLMGASPELSDFLLERAASLGEAELRQAAERDAHSAAAVARRADLTPTLADALSRLNEADVLVALAANPSAPLEGSLFGRLARDARLRAAAGDPRLADALLQRRPVLAEGALLFLEAHPPERVEILLAAQRQQLGRPPGRLPLVDEAGLERMEAAAVSRRPDEFVAALSGALGCGDELARRIVADPTGEPLAVALTALGAPNGMLVRVLISNDLDQGGFRRIRALARLNFALNRAAAVAVIAALSEGCGAERVPLRSMAGLPRPTSKARSESRRSEKAKITDSAASSA
jgi:uncharacterized protein (DUF2336 family)